MGRASFIGAGTAILACAVLLAAGVGARAAADAREPAFETTRGRTRSLEAFRGKVVVLFYETRETYALNAQLKGTLSRFVIDQRLEAHLAMVPVANVRAFAGGPMREIARRAVAELAERHDLEILLDWEGSLLAPPLSLEDGASNVVLMDPTGRVLRRFSGALGEVERRNLMRDLRAALRQRATPHRAAVPRETARRR